MMERSLEDRLIEAALAFDLAVRDMQGVDGALLADLREALQEAAIAWAELDRVPREIVNLYVDFQPALLASMEAYPEPTKSQIFDVIMELADLIRATVAM